jgi:hypothetical protein
MSFTVETDLALEDDPNAILVGMVMMRGFIAVAQDEDRRAATVSLGQITVDPTVWHFHVGDCEGEFMDALFSCPKKSLFFLGASQLDTIRGHVSSPLVSLCP